MKTTHTVSLFLTSLLLSLTSFLVSADTYRPGLLQAQSAANNAWDLALEDSIIPVERVPGPVMADVYADETSYLTLAQSYSNRVTNTLYHWRKQNSTYAYEGEIFLEAGITYAFAKRLDDAARILIGAPYVTVLNNTTWNNFATALYTPTETGWYPIRILAADGTGGKGPQDGGINKTGLGLAYNTTGIRTENSPDWTQLLDPGDMSLFRVLTDENPELLRGASLADGIYTLTLGVADGSGTGTAQVFLGEAGTDPATWTASSEITLSADDSATISLPWTGTGTPAVIIHASGTDPFGTFETISDPILLQGSFFSQLRHTVRPEALDTTAIHGSLVYNNGLPTTELTLSYSRVGVPNSTRHVTQTVTVGEAFAIPLTYTTWDSTYEYELTQVGNPTPLFSGTFSTPCENAPRSPGLIQGRYTFEPSDPQTHTRIADLPSEAIDTTLGMLMARPSSDNQTSGCTDALTTQSWGWDESYLCFVYEGSIWLEKNVPFYVGSRFDDGGAIYIDGNEVFSQWTANGTAGGWNARYDYTCSVYTPTFTGWHEFRGYIWDWAGDKQRQWGLAGVQWSTKADAVTIADGKVTGIKDLLSNPGYWNEFYDDGSGTFLSDAGPVIAVSAAAMEGDTLAAVLTVPARGPCSIVAWYGETYGADDPATWDNVSETLATVTGATAEEVNVRLPLGANDRQVRFVAIPADGSQLSISPTLFRSQLSTISAAPLVLATLPSEISYESIRPTLNVQSAGLGATSCDLYAVYGFSADNLSYTNLLASGQTSGTILSPELSNLLPGHQYFLVIRAVSDQGEVFLTEPLVFSTAALTEDSAPAPESIPGLWFAVISGFNHLEDPRTRSDAEIVPGAMMASVANQKTPFTSYITPSGRTILPSNKTTYAHAGYMYLEAGTTYTFGADYDDMSYIAVDGQVLINDTGWNTQVYAPFTPSLSGWYAIDARVSDDGGNNGPTGGGFTTDYLGTALAYSTTASDLTTTNFREWHALTNTVDDIRFRTEPLLPTLGISSFSTTEDSLATNLALSDNPHDLPLYVCYGPSFAGTNLTDWAHVEPLGTLEGGTSTYTTSDAISDLYDTTRYVRYYLDCGRNGLVWSRTLVFTDPGAPSLAGETRVIGIHQGDAVTLAGSLDATGGSDCTLVAEVSLDPTLANAITWPIDTLSAPGDFSIDLYSPDPTSPTYITPGATYYARFKATNQDGLVDVTSIAVFTTDDGVKLDPLTASSTLFDVTLSGTFADFGANDTTLWLYVGSSPETLEPVQEQILTSGNNGYQFSYVVPSLGTPYYYAVLASNACSTASWTDRTPTLSHTGVDTARYYWRADVLSGDWNDPACWEPDPADPRLTYPNSSEARARFTRCLPGTPYTVNVPADYTAYTLTVTTPDTDVTFVGSNRETSRIHTTHSYDENNEGIGIAEGASVTFDGVAFSTTDCLRLRNRATLRLLNAASFTLPREIWMTGNDSLIEARGDSLISLTGYTFDLSGSNGRVLLDNSTLTLSNHRARLSDNNGSTNNLIEFFGDHPKFAARNFNVAENSSAENAAPATFRFHVPANGYVEAPIQRTAENNVLQNADKQDLHIEIAADSPAFQTGSTCTTTLISWAPGINAARVTLENQPQPANTSFLWTYGTDPTDLTATTPPTENANPTGLHVSLKGAGATLLLLR